MNFELKTSPGDRFCPGVVFLFAPGVWSFSFLLVEFFVCGAFRFSSACGAFRICLGGVFLFAPGVEPLRLTNASAMKKLIREK